MDGFERKPADSGLVRSTFGGTPADAARQELLVRFHAERALLAARMDQEHGEQERRQLRDELRQLDERYLQQLASYPADTRYQLDRSLARWDEVLHSVISALLLRLAYSAERRSGRADVKQGVHSCRSRSGITSKQV